MNNQNQITVKTALRQTGEKAIKYNPETLIYLLQNNDFSNKPLFECYGGTIAQEPLIDMFVKPFFDLDCVNDFEVEAPFIDAETMYDRAIEFITKYFECTENDIVASTAHIPNEKHSFHFLVTNKKIMLSNLIAWAKLPNIKEQMKSICLDNSIYKKGQLRVVLTSKEGQNRPLRPISDNYDILDHLVTYTENIDTEFSFDIDYLKTSVKQQKEITKLETKKLQHQLDSHPSFEHSVIENLLKCLKDERCNDYCSWIDVGTVIKISGGNFQIFNEWSKQCHKYDEQSCWDAYNAIKPNGQLTIASLHFWAKQDNIVEYKKYFTPTESQLALIEVIKTNFNTAITTDKGLANILCFIANKYDSKHIQLITTVGKQWYLYRNERWNSDINSDSNIFYSFINNIAEKVLVKLYDVIDDDEILLKVSGILNKIGHKKDIEDCSKFVYEMCFDASFKQRLNTNPYLVGCKNGIVDLKTIQLVENSPNLFITNYLNYNFDLTTCDKSNATYQELIQWLTQVLPDQETLNYVLMISATGLIGLLLREKITFFIGSGRNGKSKFLELLMMSLDGYSVQASQSLILKGEKADGEAKLSLRGKRLACFNEFEEDAKLDTVMLKSISGNDQISCRGLYEKQVSFKVVATSIVALNNSPNLPAKDKAIWSRVEFIYWSQRFLHSTDPDYNPDNPNHHLVDETIVEKIPLWAESFLNFMILHAHEIINKRMNIIPPKVVLDKTSETRSESDCYASFIKECVVVVPKCEQLPVSDEKCRNIQLKDLWDAMKHSDFYSNSCNKKTLKSTLMNYGVQFEERALRLEGRPHSVFYNCYLVQSEDECLI